MLRFLQGSFLYQTREIGGSMASRLGGGNPTEGAGATNLGGAEPKRVSDPTATRVQNIGKDQTDEAQRAPPGFFKQVKSLLSGKDDMFDGGGKGITGVPGRIAKFAKGVMGGAKKTEASAEAGKTDGAQKAVRVNLAGRMGFEARREEFEGGIEGRIHDIRKDLTHGNLPEKTQHDLGEQFTKFNNKTFLPAKNRFNELNDKLGKTTDQKEARKLFNEMNNIVKTLEKKMTDFEMKVQVAKSGVKVADEKGIGSQIREKAWEAKEAIGNAAIDAGKALRGVPGNLQDLAKRAVRKGEEAPSEEVTDNVDVSPEVPVELTLGDIQVKIDHLFNEMGEIDQKLLDHVTKLNTSGIKPKPEELEELNAHYEEVKTNFESGNKGNVAAAPAAAATPSASGVQEEGGVDAAESSPNGTDAAARPAAATNVDESAQPKSAIVDQIKANRGVRDAHINEVTAIRKAFQVEYDQNKKSEFSAASNKFKAALEFSKKVGERSLRAERFATGNFANLTEELIAEVKDQFKSYASDSDKANLLKECNAQLEQANIMLAEAKAELEKVNPDAYLKANPLPKGY